MEVTERSWLDRSWSGENNILSLSTLSLFLKLPGVSPGFRCSEDALSQACSAQRISALFCCPSLKSIASFRTRCVATHSPYERSKTTCRISSDESFYLPSFKVCRREAGFSHRRARTRSVHSKPHPYYRSHIPASDPQFSAAKRQQRTNVFTSSMAHASLERQLLQARSEKVELEAKLRERDSTIERLEGDRRLLALREQSEREEKEQEQMAREKDKVRQL